MKNRSKFVTTLLAALATYCFGGVDISGTRCARGAGGIGMTPFATLARNAKSRCRIVVGMQPSFMERRAALEIANVIRRDGAASVSISPSSDLNGITDPVVLVGTPKSIPLITKLAVSSRSLTKLSLIGRDGYIIETLKHKGRKFIVISGLTPRAVFCGAVYAGEQLTVE